MKINLLYSFLITLFSFFCFNASAISDLSINASCKGLGLSSLDTNLQSMFNSAEQLACVSARQSYQCEKMEADLEGEDKNKVIHCDQNSLKSNSLSNTNGFSCVWNGLKISGENLVNLAKLPGTIADAAMQGFKETQECNKSLDKKREILNAFNLSVTDKRFKLEESFLGRSFPDMSCAELEKRTHDRFENYNNQIMREMIAAKNTGKTYKIPDHLLAKNSEILINLDAIFKEAGVTYNCYTPKAKAEMVCAGVTSLLADVALGVGFSKAITAVRSIAKSKKALNGINRSVVSGEKANLSDSSLLNPADRVKAGEAIVGRSLTKSEAKAIEAAHQIGLKEGRGFYTYTQEDIAKKTKILDDAGFSKVERRKLMENGITGKENDYYAHLYMQKQVLKVEARSEKIQVVKGANGTISPTESMHSAQVGIEKALSERDLATAEAIQSKLAGTASTFSTAEKVQAADFYLGRTLSSEQKIALTKAIESGDLFSLSGKSFAPKDIEKIQITMKSERKIASSTTDLVDHSQRVKGESIISKFTSTGDRSKLNEGLAETRKFYKKYLDNGDSMKLFTNDNAGFANIKRANEYGLTAKESAQIFKRNFGGPIAKSADAYKSALADINASIKEYEQMLSSRKVGVSESIEFKIYRAKELRQSLASDYYSIKYPNKFEQLDMNSLSDREAGLLNKWGNDLLQDREKMKKLKLPVLE
jgi:Na+-transporting NADH:ubiquinone oxidoreductase subunit NqrC